MFKSFITKFVLFGDLALCLELFNGLVKVGHGLYRVKVGLVLQIRDAVQPGLEDIFCLDKFCQVFALALSIENCEEQGDDKNSDKKFAGIFHNSSFVVVLFTIVVLSSTLLDPLLKASSH